VISRAYYPTLLPTVTASWSFRPQESLMERQNLLIQTGKLWSRRRDKNSKRWWKATKRRVKLKLKRLSRILLKEEKRKYSRSVTEVQCNYTVVVCVYFLTIAVLSVYLLTLPVFSNRMMAWIRPCVPLKLSSPNYKTKSRAKSRAQRTRQQRRNKKRFL